ncbi:MAG TPA: efflux RND transporter periplasmic adaptor subunit [Thermoanaerobacterales bacterium]|nr:efflux RND transporter periplasmic adaptor subunit [Thermoanaerobacterales bacterium]
MQTRDRKTAYILLVLMVVILFSGCGQKPAATSEPEKVVAVRTSFSKVEDLAEYQSFPGKVQAAGEVSLSAKIGGRVEEILVKEGQEVKKGQVLIKLEQKDVKSQVNQAQAAYNAAAAQLESLKNGQLPQQIAQLESVYNQAQANYKNAEENYNRMKTLLEQGAVSKQQFEGAELQYKVAKEQFESARTQLMLTKEKTGPESIFAAEAQVNQAKAALSAAQAALDNTLITAPVDGTVGFISVRVGQLLSPGVTAITVGDLKNAEIEINVTEDRISALRVGQEAEVSVDSAGLSAIKGVIESISPFKDPRTQVYPVKIKVPNGGGLLKSGMFARVKLIVAFHQKVVTVPEDAVVSYDGVEVVYTVDNNVAKAQQVETGAASMGKIIITKGLSPGQQIVVEGQDLLQDGVKVSVESRGDAK